MTAFTSADIPPTIKTVEQLYVWASVALTTINPTLTAVEGVGIAERVAQTNIYYISADAKSRILSRVSLEIAPEYLAGGKHLWEYVAPLSELPLPDALKP